MNSKYDKTKVIAENEEVREALKTLSKYGLGILMVHSHDENGNFSDLPKGVVAYEEDLKVTFKAESPEDKQDYMPVAWQWDEDSGEAVAISSCKVHQWCEER
ncbi:hypothetical protein [uncultured Acinetobacter sp.]|uniref:hypothetical protein n=1 Tax=uncultured Acinetobacter sp. TaxID=165433 RepID=UPI002582C82E|nr:hypothetical protein [uncultured Acinetobacter sp.]